MAKRKAEYERLRPLPPLEPTSAYLITWDSYQLEVRVAGRQDVEVFEIPDIEERER